jgi:molybdenum cofactor synthesis domain-containing protein
MPAAALIIGNELLTGKIEDKNLIFLAKELYAVGLELTRAIFCGDEVEQIARDLRALRETHEVVFTSGGVGPTHDDKTLEGVAAAFGVPLRRDPHLAELIREHFKERTTEAHLRMADIPEGATLLSGGEVVWPVVALDGVYVLPGVPEIFRLKLRVVIDQLKRGQPFVTRSLYTLCDEGTIAALLSPLEERFVGVRVGSYPSFRDPVYKVKITFDGQDPALVEAALAALIGALPADLLVRSE